MRPCFPSTPHSDVSDSPVKEWLAEYHEMPILFRPDHALALSRLLPLLICGEQSSQWVFYNEGQRLSSEEKEESQAAFLRIVSDEQHHEIALKAITEQLPRPFDLNSLRRRSQHFYTRLGRQETLAEHFALVACLDGLVCRIMKAMERSDLGEKHPFTLLCRAIKKDEARHVSIARKHALALGFDTQNWPAYQQQMTANLREMMEPEAQAFATLGVKLESIFRDKRSDDDFS